MSVPPFDAIDLIRTDGRQLLDAVQRVGLDHPVESCPGWTTGDLAWHIGEVWEFWTTVVRDRITSVDVLRQLPDLDRPDADDLLDWVAVAHNGLISTLVDTPPDTEVWTWTGANRDAAWVRRRMAHETAVHRWDAERAVGDPHRVPFVVAADGIEEFLQYFATRGREQPLGGTVHLHCTDTGADTGGEWIIHRLDADGIEYGHAHEKGDVAIRGRAGDLLLWLWGRDADPVEVLGDAAVAERFRNGADLD